MPSFYDDVIDLSDSPTPPTPPQSKPTINASASASSSTSSSAKKRRRTDASDDTEPCAACDATGRVPKKAKGKGKKKKEETPSRWPWIDGCRPDLRFSGTTIEFYNCGGLVFKAMGKTMEARLDKLEKYLEECEGDETRHPTYGRAW